MRSDYGRLTIIQQGSAWLLVSSSEALISAPSPRESRASMPMFCYQTEFFFRRHRHTLQVVMENHYPVFEGIVYAPTPELRSSIVNNSQDRSWTTMQQVCHYDVYMQHETAAMLHDDMRSCSLLDRMTMGPQ